METISARLPGYTINEYLLVLDPNEALRHKVEKSRQELLENFSIAQPPVGRPHVSLVRFTATAMMEQKLIHRLRVIAMAEQP